MITAGLCLEPALAGWPGGQAARSPELTIEAETPYCVVAASSFGREPIATANRLLVTAVAGWTTYLAYGHLSTGRGYPVLGLSIGAGCLVHLLGDVITKEGCPLFWPLPIAHRRWYDVGVPNAVAVKVGGAMEVIVLRTMFFLISLGAAAGLAQHWASTQIGRFTG